MSKILGISGKMGSGKDTLADLLVANSNGGWVKDAFARPVKEELHQLYTILHEAQSSPSRDVSHQIAATMDVALHDADVIAELIQTDILENSQHPDTLAKTSTYRLVMQTWATGIRRAQNPLYWVEQAFANHAENLQNNISVVFADVRFENEADAVLDHGGLLVRLDIPETTQLERLFQRDGVYPDPASLLHESEVSLDDFPDFTQVYDTVHMSPEDILHQIHNLS